MKDVGAVIVEQHAVTELTIYLEKLAKEISKLTHEEALQANSEITAAVLGKVLHAKWPRWIAGSEISTSKDLMDEASRKRSRLLQITSPEVKKPLTDQNSATLEDKLASVPAAGNDDSSKKGILFKGGTNAREKVSPLVLVPAIERERYEREVKVDARLDKCLVCKRDLVGDVYICPACKVAKYHESCVQALIQDGEPCWACRQPFVSSEGSEDISIIQEEILAIDGMIAVLTSQHEMGELSDETFKKRSNQFKKERTALEKRIKKDISLSHPKQNTSAIRAPLPKQAPGPASALVGAPVKITDENILKYMLEGKYVKISYIIRAMNITDVTEARFLEVKLRKLINQGKIQREMQDGRFYYKKK
jgi:hypothetical protein